MKPILCALAFLITLAPALAQDAATVPVAAQVQSATLPSVTLDNGIIVTPIVRQSSDLEQMMDVKMWQFHVQRPTRGAVIQPQLQLREPGKEPRNLEGMTSFFGQEKTDMVVGIAPANASFLDSADKWKVYVRTRDLQDTEPTMFDITSTSEIGNPLKEAMKGLNSRSTDYKNNGRYALPGTDGVIPLVSYYGAAIDGPPMMTNADDLPLIAELVLVFTVERR